LPERAAPFLKLDEVQVSLGRRFDHAIFRVAELDILVLGPGGARRAGRPIAWLAFLAARVGNARQIAKTASKQRVRDFIGYCTSGFLA